MKNLAWPRKRWDFCFYLLRGDVLALGMSGLDRTVLIPWGSWATLDNIKMWFELGAFTLEPGRPREWQQDTGWGLSVMWPVVFHRVWAQTARVSRRRSHPPTETVFHTHCRTAVLGKPRSPGSLELTEDAAAGVFLWASSQADRPLTFHCSKL